MLRPARARPEPGVQIPSAHARRWVRDQTSPEEMLSCLAYEGDYAPLDYGRLRRLRQAGAIALIAILLIGSIVLGKNIAKNIFGGLLIGATKITENVYNLPTKFRRMDRSAIKYVTVSGGSVCVVRLVIEIDGEQHRTLTQTRRAASVRDYCSGKSTHFCSDADIPLSEDSGGALRSSSHFKEYGFRVVCGRQPA
jgi:hypothetical protein